MICFTGRTQCPTGFLYRFPLTPVLLGLEWPWADLVPPGLFAGPVWGKLFVLGSILVNSTVLFATATAVGWLGEGYGKRPRSLVRETVSWTAAWLRRIVGTPPVPSRVAAFVYLVVAVAVWLKSQICSGWIWFCTDPLLEKLVGPWVEWMGWTFTASPVSLIETFGPLGARLFVLGLLAFNAALIFLLGSWYERIFTRWRHDPPELMARTAALFYALPALYWYVDGLLCTGMFCALPVTILAWPWSSMNLAPLIPISVMLLPLAMNIVLLYGASLLLGRLVRVALP